MDLALAVLLILAFLAAWQEGRHRTCGFAGALLLCLALSPFLGYLLLGIFPLKRPIGCRHCGNRANEASRCGLCGHRTDEVPNSA